MFARSSHFSGQLDESNWLILAVKKLVVGSEGPGTVAQRRATPLASATIRV